MLISCPSCASQYAIDPDRIGATGRVVRCAACREPWFIPGTMHEAASAPPAVEAGPKSRPNRRTKPSRSDKPRERKPWGASVACFGFAAALAAGIALRSEIVRQVPQTASVYAALGLPVNLVGLTLTEVRSQVAQGPVGRVLTVTAAIANPGFQPVHVPRLAVSIVSDKGDTLYDWTVPPTEPHLAPGASTRFEAKLASPPPEGRTVTLTFSTTERLPKVASH